ncbi:AAA domain-containing protein [Microvirga sp. VF16]|uniref:AAA domain-containing protein n=1 Tax=Microvirga sp. VF16 TaxID=2807101 RepID=UPI00193CB60C|nr:AAA domain-containing protein [Microvirga sp. VF16]QRM34826.1 AAA family ATPase [Microvirga sp. VF16]
MIQQAEIASCPDPVMTFITDAYRALTDLGLRNKMISLPAASSRGRSIDLAVDPDALVEFFAQPDAAGKIGSDILPLAQESQRSAADLRRSIISLIADAEIIASEQGIETRRLALGMIEWKDADGANRTAPMFTIPVTVTNDLTITQAGPLEPNETFPLFADSFGCTVGIDPTKPPSRALVVKAHAVEPVKPGGIAILGYKPRVNLNLYAGKSAAMHRAVDISARPHLTEVGALRILAGLSPASTRNHLKTPNLHIVDADLSQDEVVTAARAGESFVLQGPPGTGKSQTIVNVVANLLNDGKRVLVSAEKTAALEVIADRWPKNVQGIPCPVLLTEGGAPLGPEAQFAVATPAVAALKIPPGVSFDTLIVDEASQMRLAHSAVVAALADQIIVIGDSQQMAPSNLFARVGQTQVSATMIHSLLDHAVASNLPSRLLKQHYRSKHESLILFSNKNYYRGQLDIIPSPLRNGSLGTAFKFVSDAVYDRGGAGDNVVEANALISDALEIAKANNSRRRNPLGGTPRSVGIITLNENQRDLILTLLPEALERQSLSELDLAGTNGHGRHFVKALENVQGDERDIILVSTTYGRDRKQRFIANLGVLSQPGAANRVNVLATRSKWKTVVYHSFEMELLADASSDGAESFRKYWREVQNCSEIRPSLVPLDESNPGDDLELAFRLMQKRLKFERYFVHKFPRFVAGFEKDDPHRYVISFYITGLYSPLQEASDIARIKNAGWQLCRIPIDEWRADPEKMADGVYRVMSKASLVKIDL